MKILLDTNFVIDLVRFKLVLEEASALLSGPYTLVTLDSVINELTSISKSKSKSGSYAQLALTMLGGYTIEILKSRKSTDDAILELGKSKNVVVATNDSALRKRLKRLGKKTIYLKGKKHLAIG